jgi:hypothetical protein
MKTDVKPTSRQEHWLSHLKRARALKMPLAQYCRARGLKVQSLYNARHELSGKRRGVSKPVRKKAAGAGRFIALELSGMAAAAPASVCRIQLRDVVIECATSPSAGAGAGVRGLGTSIDVRAGCSELHWLDENRRLSSGAHHSLRRTAFHLECLLLNR